MNNKFLKILSIILNVILLILFFVFTIMSKISYTLMQSSENIPSNWLGYASIYTLMALPLFIVLALAMSIGYRKEDEFKKSVFIQFLPAAIYFIGMIFSFLSQS